eukprot:2704014-Rhodomonas_salina.1
MRDDIKHYCRNASSARTSRTVCAWKEYRVCTGTRTLGSPTCSEFDSLNFGIQDRLSLAAVTPRNVGACSTRRLRLSESRFGWSVLSLTASRSDQVRVLTGRA